MVEWWWGVVGAAIPAVAVGGAWMGGKRRAEEERGRAAGRDKGGDDIFVCQRVCTSKRMLNKVGAFSKDPITPPTCVTSCGVSDVDACADACARTLCANPHHIPSWNDICLRRCQSQCLKGDYDEK
ncbi:hypothetical protein KP509_04G087200 [Ceratopteris richardii]|uniref:Uncharacterized protein n=1 Tax=Ceratopteris richardii TaxID=49495 RepID=A0A8T2UXN8_CERRI|nr:hypothetical protein KP509_04G087200 [Ceratopteris richardii]